MSPLMRGDVADASTAIESYAQALQHHPFVLSSKANALSRRCFSSGKRTVNAVMSYLHQEGCQSSNIQLRKTQLHISQMTQIARHDEIRPAGNSKFFQMVVSLIRQIGPP